MAGVFVLLGFVLLVFVVGSCLLIICYWRSKSEERKEAKEEYEYNPYGSQVIHSQLQLRDSFFFLNGKL